MVNNITKVLRIELISKRITNFRSYYTKNTPLQSVECGQTYN